MQNSGLVDLTSDELFNISAGAEPYTCALLGAITAVAFFSGQWYAAAGAFVASYGNNCFEF